MCAADWPVVDGAASVLPDDDSNLLRGIPDRWRRRTADLQAMLALSDADLRKILLRVPDVVDLSFFSNVQPTLLALQQTLRALPSADDGWLDSFLALDGMQALLDVLSHSQV